jgi:hypothetical protein
MSAKDIFHEQVKVALEKEAWTTTDDPLYLRLGRDKAQVDFGAEKLLTAQKGQRKIAVEVKSFVGASEVHDLHEALGQYLVYQTMLERTEYDRKLYLAVSEEVFERIFMRDLGAALIESHNLSMLIFDDQAQVIIRWIL